MGDPVAPYGYVHDWTATRFRLTEIRPKRIRAGGPYKTLN